MTPGSVRALLTLFAILAIGVAVNALLLQADTPAIQSARAEAQIAKRRANVERLRQVVGERVPVTREVAGEPVPAERPFDFETLAAPATPALLPAPP